MNSQLEIYFILFTLLFQKKTETERKEVLVRDGEHFMKIENNK